MNTSIYDFKVNNSRGELVDLSQYKDRVLLIVNTASACGFTPQYAGLEQLYKQYQAQGLVVLAFPCNQFGQQEKGNAEEIQQFCDLNFNISFPLMEKIEVNGDNSAALYQYLKSQAKGILGTKRIKWNFTKFLINRQGQVVKRYAPTAKPESLKQDIEKLL